MKPGEKYFVVRNQSSVIAWVQGNKPLAEQGWRILGAHTDSPCLKVKPKPDLFQHGCWSLGVEVYGGALLNPWFDRDLSLAGRVHSMDANRVVTSTLVDLKNPVAVIPSLAIHLDRDANKNKTVNAQQHLPAMLGCSKEKSEEKHAGLIDFLLKYLKDNGVDADRVLDHELMLYDTQPSAIIGVNNDYIASARLDNLLSCYVDICALVDAADSGQWSLVVCNDHEEVGSQSAAGAAGPFLQQVLQRIEPQADAFSRAISNSTLISTDNAHALHPNYADKMDSNHAPLVNGGPVIKVNANQRYASNSETQALFRAVCEQVEVPVQDFVMRSDMACGSTIGPITAAALGIKTLDVGVPTFAMHSIRELAGSRDPINLSRALSAFLSRQT